MSQNMESLLLDDSDDSSDDDDGVAEATSAVAVSSSSGTASTAAAAVTSPAAASLLKESPVTAPAPAPSPAPAPAPVAPSLTPAAASVANTISQQPPPKAPSIAPTASAASMAPPVGSPPTGQRSGGRVPSLPSMPQNMSGTNSAQQPLTSWTSPKIQPTQPQVPAPSVPATAANKASAVQAAVAVQARRAPSNMQQQQGQAAARAATSKPTSTNTAQQQPHIPAGAVQHGIPPTLQQQQQRPPQQQNSQPYRAPQIPQQRAQQQQPQPHPQQGNKQGGGDVDFGMEMFEPTPLSEVIARTNKQKQQVQQQGQSQTQQQSMAQTAAQRIQAQRRGALPTVTSTSTVPSSSVPGVTTSSIPSSPAIPGSRSMSSSTSSATAAEKEVKARKDKFLMFTRVLMKYLEQKDPAMYKEARHVIKECAEKNKAKDPAYASLTMSMQTRLRATVGDVYWKKAEEYLNQFIKQKQKQAHAQAAQMKAKAAAAASSAVQTPTVQQRHYHAPQQRSATTQQPQPTPTQTTSQPPKPMSAQEAMQKAQAAALAAKEKAMSASGFPPSTYNPLQPTISVKPPTTPSSTTTALAQHKTQAELTAEAKAKAMKAMAVRNQVAQVQMKQAEAKAVKGSQQPESKEAKRRQQQQQRKAAAEKKKAAAAQAKALAQQQQQQAKMAAAAKAQAHAQAQAQAAAEEKQQQQNADAAVKVQEQQQQFQQQQQQALTSPSVIGKKAPAGKKTVGKKPGTPKQTEQREQPGTPKVDEKPKKPKVYDELMEMIDHSVEYDWTTAASILSENYLSDVNLDEEQRRLLYGMRKIPAPLPTVRGQQALAVQDILPGMSASARSASPQQAIPCGWSAQNIVSARIAWARVRLQEQLDFNSTGLPFVLSSSSSSTISISSPSTVAAGNPAGKLNNLSLSNSAWYNEEKAEQDPALALLSHATQAYLKSLLEGAVSVSRRRQNLDAVRLWHRQHSGSKQPLSLRLGCDVRRQASLAAGNAAKIVQRMEEALARSGPDRKRKVIEGENTEKDGEAIGKVCFEATSMGDLSRKLFPEWKAASEFAKQADLDAKFNFEVYGGRDSGAPPFGRVPNKSTLLLKDFRVCIEDPKFPFKRRGVIANSFL